MPSFVRFLHCVARAAVRKGGKALCSLVPLGDVAYEIASDAYEDYCRESCEGDLRADLEQLAQASQSEARQAAEQVAGEEAAGQPPEILQAVTSYLAQVPNSLKQALRRPTDPSGTTLPAGRSLGRPEDLLALLPEGLPRFRPGDRPLAADWELVELLGKGGFGEVWKARHLTRTSVRPVALKFCLDPRAADSLRNEASLHDLLDRLRQQNSRLGVVPLLETFLRSDPPCLMYELIEGGDLAGLVREMQAQGTLTPEFTTRLVHRLASIVAAAHRLDPPLVHRDLKMSNVLVRRGEGGKLSLLVADFGIGGLASQQMLREQAGRSGTRSQTSAAVRGAYTPLYASPQQAGGGPPDPRDDVHALGVLWYQMLTGDLLMTAIPPDWREVVEERGVGSEQAQLLASCIASRAERRPADAAELAAQLATLLRPVTRGGGGASAAVSAGTSLPPAPRPEQRTRHAGKGTWVNSLGNEMIPIPTDQLPSGASPGRLYVSRTCVSNRDYREYVLAGGRPPRIHPKYPDQRTWNDHNVCPASMLRHPVVYVTHADAVAFCDWLTRRERETGAAGPRDGYRLPRLREWKALARGSQLTDSTVVDRQWPPGQLQPTEPVDHETSGPLGLHRLLGNVFEWCSDSDEAAFNLPGGGGKKKVPRFVAVGGGWGSSRSWLQGEVDRGTFGAILCPHGWPMRDGGFRLCLVATE